MFNLIPRDTVFFDLFEGLAGHVVTTARHLENVGKEFPQIEGHIRAIRQEEHEADELAHRALERLDRMFITPFDREDIHILVKGLDDIVDEMDSLAKRFTLYHVKAIDPVFCKQTAVLVAATMALAEAVGKLRKNSKLSDLAGVLKEVHRLENVGDENNHEAISRLYEGKMEVLEVMKWKELFDRAEKAIDMCQDVGDTLERIMLKHG